MGPIGRCVDVITVTSSFARLTFKLFLFYSRACVKHKPKRRLCQKIYHIFFSTKSSDEQRGKTEVSFQYYLRTYYDYGLNVLC